jgi:hypothetical protein
MSGCRAETFASRASRCLVVLESITWVMALVKGATGDFSRIGPRMGRDIIMRESTELHTGIGLGPSYSTLLPVHIAS